MLECKLCGQKFLTDIELSDHLLDYHMIDYPTYCEIVLQGEGEDYSVCSCGKLRPKVALTWPWRMEDDRCEHFLPCWSCATSRSIKGLLFNQLQDSLSHYYKELLEDRYFQLFLVDPIYFDNTLPHRYSTFKSLLSKISTPGRGDYWLLDWKVGYPKTISDGNLSGLVVSNFTGCIKVEQGSDTVVVGRYRIHLPDRIPHESKHFGRYNLLSPNSSRMRKRVKLSSTNETLKLFNQPNLNSPTLFNITDIVSGKSVPVTEISHQDFTLIKLTVLRCKPFLRQIIELAQELSKSCSIFRDAALLRNTVQVSSDSSGTCCSIAWTPLDFTSDKRFINVSIL